MTTSAGTPGRARFTGEQISEMLALLKDADSVELKLTVPESEQRSAIAALDIDPLDAQMRQVVFFDTPDLALNQRGIVLRARRSQGGANDSVVKLRPVVPTEVPEDLRRSPSFVTEVDAMPGGYVCSGTLKARLAEPEVKDAIAGRRPVRKLFTKDQRAFFAEHVGEEGPGFDDLAALGPIIAFKLRLDPEGFGRRLVAELWFYPDGSRILELSTKCPPSLAFQVAAEAAAFLSDRGIEVSGEQQTKTRTALDYFAGQLALGPGDTAG
jgi:hypothetical protein